jgi:hypothetical protein
MKISKRRIVTLVAGLLMVLSGVALAENGAVGSVEVGGGELFITPNVPYAELQVTVAGDGVYWQKNYSSDERASVSLSEIGIVSDGSYGYEIIAAPEVDAEAWVAAEGDEAAEQSLEAEESARTYLQQGGFQVVSGQVVVTSPRVESDDTRQPLILQE